MFTVLLLNTDLNSCAVFMLYAFKIGVLFDSERAVSRHQTGWIIDRDESLSKAGEKWHKDQTKEQRERQEKA